MIDKWGIEIYFWNLNRGEEILELVVENVNRFRNNV